MPSLFIAQLSKLIKLMIQAVIKDCEVQCPEGHSCWKLCYWEESIHWNVKRLKFFEKVQSSSLFLSRVLTRFIESVSYVLSSREAMFSLFHFVL